MCILCTYTNVHTLSNLATFNNHFVKENRGFSALVEQISNHVNTTIQRYLVSCILTHGSISTNKCMLMTFTHDLCIYQENLQNGFVFAHQGYQCNLHAAWFQRHRYTTHSTFLVEFFMHKCTQTRLQLYGVHLSKFGNFHW